MPIDKAEIEAFCAAQGIRPVEVRGIDNVTGTFTGEDGCVYTQVQPNYWATGPREANNVVYLHSNIHDGGVLLRPVFVRIKGCWYNAFNGKDAPSGFPYTESRTAHRPAVSVGSALVANGGKEEMDSESMADNTRFDDGDWAHRAELLVRINEASAWSVDDETVYTNLCGAIMAAVKSEHCFLHLLAFGEDTMIRYGVARNADFYASEWGETLPSNVGRTQWLLKTANPIIMDYAHPHEKDRILPAAINLGYKSAISIPVTFDGSTLGMCSFSYKRTIHWTDDDIVFLKQIGREVGVAVNRIRMAKRFSELQLLEERQRLSSEIHDNISHLVGSVSLCAGTALACYDEADMKGVERNLERMEKLCGQTMRVFRDEMLSLRIPLDHTEGWLASVKGILANFEQEWGIGIELTVDAEHDPILVNTQSSLQLSRVLNECLSNVLRHADATKVDVIILEDAHALCMKVRDNGCGFNLAKVAPERLGLKIMRERAAVIGGEVLIRSEVGHGTEVEVRIPRIVQAQW